MTFAVIALMTVATAQASEIGHFSAGLPNIRDFVVPDPGFYGFMYNNVYASDQLNDRNGDKIDKITIGVPPQSATLDLAVDLDVYVAVPGFMWVSNWNVIGARYAAYAMLPFANTSIGASLAAATGTGRGVEDSQFGIADWFVQPLWLDLGG